MRVKVIKSGSPDYWYADHIGKIFEVYPLGVGANNYMVVGPLPCGGTGYIDSDDCEVVHMSIDDHWDMPRALDEFKKAIEETELGRSVNGAKNPFTVDDEGRLSGFGIGVQEQGWSNQHYDFDYQLTQADIEAGKVRIDPYFVSYVWKLGSKDESGAVFHCLKTLARFGTKNAVEREIKALDAQVKALARIYGVSL